MQCLRRVAEENLNILKSRHQWVTNGGVEMLIGLDQETSSVLRSLPVDSLELVADAATPIFSLALDHNSLQNLSKAEPCKFPNRELQDLVTAENTEVLMNRWHAAGRDEIQAKLVYGMSQATVDWLRAASVSQLMDIIRSGHQCVRFLVKPAYLWQAARSAHLTQTQRSALVLAGSKTYRATSHAPFTGVRQALSASVLEQIQAAAEAAELMWDSPVFNARFEQLVMFTGRPSVIRQLLDINPTSKELRRRVKLVEDKYRIERPPPKAKGPSFDNPGVLKTNLERYHASVIISLVHSSGAAAAVLTGGFADHLLEIYQKYLLVTGSNISSAVVDFEIFLEIVNALSSAKAETAECVNCGTTYMYKSRDTRTSCPMCELHNHHRFDISDVLRRYPQQPYCKAVATLPKLDLQSASA